MMQMETPTMTGSELIKYYTSGTGIPAAYAQHARRHDPPVGSDLTEQFQVVVRVLRWGRR
jgi:hypothetical protein